MTIVLLILILLTGISLLIRKTPLTIIACVILLGTLVGRDMSVDARVRSDYFANKSYAETGKKVSTEFHRGERAVVMYLRDTRRLLYVSSALIILLLACGRKKPDQ